MNWIYFVLGVAFVVGVLVALFFPLQYGVAIICLVISAIRETNRREIPILWRKSRLATKHALNQKKQEEGRRMKA